MSRTVTVTSSMCAAGAPGCQLLAILPRLRRGRRRRRRDRKWWKYKPDKWRYFMFQLSTLHTSQLRLSPPRNLIINPLSRLWDKLLPDQIGINRRISSGEEEVEVVVVVVVVVVEVSR